MAYTITIDLDKCIGCGACERCDNFVLEEVNGGKYDGCFKAKVVNAKVEEIGCNQEAVELCPTEAIIVKKGK